MFGAERRKAEGRILHPSPNRSRCRFTAFFQAWFGAGEWKDRFSKLALAINRQADDFGLLDGSASSFVRRSRNEVRESASLNFGGGFEPRHNLNRQVNFQAGNLHK
ncbi:MAG: hypothetical protein WBE37_00380 [Bryobacteraceae bacterium]